MNDLISEMEKEFEKTVSSKLEKVDSGELKNVASIARQIRDEEEYISGLEKDLKNAKKKLLQLTDEDLPSILQEMGMSEFKLDDGSQVTIKQLYGASILVDNRPMAYQWLRDNGFGDLIKNTR
jgi:predicted RNase H-like nuclease (RuvC/YqgF family)